MGEKLAQAVTAFGSTTIRLLDMTMLTWTSGNG